jgi:hypothetical protein
LRRRRFAPLLLAAAVLPAAIGVGFGFGPLSLGRGGQARQAEMAALVQIGIDDLIIIGVLTVAYRLERVGPQPPSPPEGRKQ